MIELRSDTFTLPTRAMREASACAEVGDDGYGEDPTTRALEDLAAGMLGKQAACFMPSGTMANLSAIMARCPRGSKVLAGDESDIFLYEAGGAAVCGGVMYEPIPTQPDGRLRIEDLAAAFPDDPDDPQFALPELICLENTHNRAGGRVLPLDYLREVAAFARERGVAVHLDGARIFNAAVALNVGAEAVAECADSVQFCLSKGLGAPVGSILVGPADLIARARRMRTLLGGAMRQSGILAAAGIVAMEQMVDRLREDHANARILAAELARIPQIAIDLAGVETNIVLFRVIDDRFSPREFVAAACRRGLRVSEFGRGRIRAVTYAGITPQDVYAAVAIIDELLRHGPDSHFDA